jgi:predicted amidohydrolase YtcJ
MVRPLALALPGLFALAAPAMAAAAALLIHGGPIYTGVSARPKIEAVVARDGLIVFTGSLAEARARSAGARDIDLKGAAAYPGFVDAHAHLTGIGMREMTLNLDQVSSLAELASTVKAYAAAHPGDAPIVGRGWIETHWPERRFPTRADLDAAVPGRPVWLERADGHAAVANSAALKLAGVTAATRAPSGGEILKDDAGEPTGMLVDNAMAIVNDRMPAPSPALLTEAVRRGARLYADRGWTGIGNMSVSAADVANITALAARGEMPIRTDNYVDLVAADRVLKDGPYADATGRVRVMGVKMYMDGALGSRGAALLEPYSDSPKSIGLNTLEHDLAARTFVRALKSGAQVAIHAIGDRGNRQTLDWYAEAFAATPPAKRAVAAPRWRIEHAQIISPADLPRFAALGVVASMQPSHAIGDLYFAPARLGEQRLAGAYAWNSLLRSGAVVAAGTDAPVEVGDPRIEFYAAVYRHDLKGKAGADWGLDEAVSREQALRMLTWAPAYAARHEAELGTLEVGKRADITAFSKDLMTVAPAEILTAAPVLTVVDGEVVSLALP